MVDTYGSLILAHMLVGLPCISYAQIDWGGLMAAAVLITLPVLLLAVLTQRYVIRGLTAGAVKG